jgi:hypothetical protein
MHKETNTPKLQRRSVLTATAGVAVASALPTNALAQYEASDAKLEAAWKRWRDARVTYNAAPFADDVEDPAQHDAAVDEENRLWAIMDEAEETIRANPAKTPRGAEIQLWIALVGSIDTREQDEALTRGDLAAILATEDRLDWNARLIVAALHSLSNQGR